MREIPRVVNVVPTPATRTLARRMIADAEKTSGADASLAHLHDVHPLQLVALVGLLLTATKQHKKIGRPAVPLQFSEDDRRRGYTAYRNGLHTEFTEAAYREYQRVNQQRRRARETAQVDTDRPRPPETRPA